MGPLASLARDFYGNWALTYGLGMKMGHTTKQFNF